MYIYIYIYKLMTFSFVVDEIFLSNYGNDTAVYSVKKATSLTNLFSRKLLCLYRNSSMIIIRS